MLRRLILAVAASALGGAMACASAAEASRAEAEPAYLGIETRLLDDDLVNFRVAKQGDAGREDVDAYARCAAAQYALIRGYGFARHLRTVTAQSGSLWRGDAVYTSSAAVPTGLRTLDGERVVRDCGDLGIPTV